MGRWIIVNHKHDDYASTALTLVNLTNTTRLLGGDKETNTNVKIHVLVHLTAAVQFYVYVNVELFFYVEQYLALPRC